MRTTGIPTGSWMDRFSDWQRSGVWTVLREHARREGVGARVRQNAAAADGSIPDDLGGRVCSPAPMGSGLGRIEDRSPGSRLRPRAAKAQAALGIDGPLTGVVFRSGWLDRSDAVR